jgi:hypothetical protein
MKKNILLSFLMIVSVAFATPAFSYSATVCTAKMKTVGIFTEYEINTEWNYFPVIWVESSQGKSLGEKKKEVGCECYQRLGSSDEISSKKGNQAANGQIILTNFPKAAKCKIEKNSRSFEEIDGLCQGWNIGEYNASLHEIVAVRESSGTCWAWACKGSVASSDPDTCLAAGSNSRCVKKDSSNGVTCTKDTNGIARQTPETCDQTKLNSGAWVEYSGRCLPVCSAMAAQTQQDDSTFIQFGFPTKD